METLELLMVLSELVLMQCKNKQVLFTLNSPIGYPSIISHHVLGGNLFMGVSLTFHITVTKCLTEQLK